MENLDCYPEYVRPAIEKTLKNLKEMEIPQNEDEFYDGMGKGLTDEDEETLSKWSKELDLVRNKSKSRYEFEKVLKLSGRIQIVESLPNHMKILFDGAELTIYP